MIRASDFRKGKEIKASLKRLLWERDMLLDIVRYGQSYSPCENLHNDIDWDDPEETERTKKLYDDFCDKRKSIGQCGFSDFDILCVIHWLDTEDGDVVPDFSDYTWGKVNTVEEIVWPHPSDEEKLDQWRKINA